LVLPGLLLPELVELLGELCLFELVEVVVLYIEGYASNDLTPLLHCGLGSGSAWQVA